jgi:hypothetical protein
VTKKKSARLDIPRLRLAHQHLTKPTATDPVEVVRRLGAVQAQDYVGAKWGIGMRAKEITDAMVERALNDGTLIRTHVLRPTWHIMAAADARWILALTGPRVHVANAHPYKSTGMDAKSMLKAEKIIAKVLADGNFLTRQEIGAALVRSGLEIKSHPQRLAYFVMNAELNALVCSGPKRGKQITYALFDERVPSTKPMARDDALVELARRYFATRGPATVHDYSWWSGLTIADCKKSVNLLGSELASEEIEGATYWFAAQLASDIATTNAVHLLPNYDEYFIGFKDRSAILDVVDRISLVPGDPRFAAHVVALDGQLIGGWRRTIDAKNAVVGLELVSKLSGGARRALVAVARRYGEFLELPVELTGYE